MITFLANCSDKIIDANHFLPFLQHHIQGNYLSVIPFASGADIISAHVTAFYKHELNQPFQLIIIATPGFPWEPFLKRLDDIRHHTIYLNVLIPFDPVLVYNAAALNRLQPEHFDVFNRISPYVSITCLPYSDGNAKEKILSQRNLFLFIDHLVINEMGEHNLLPHEMIAHENQFKKAEINIDNELFTSTFKSYLNTLAVIKSSLQRKGEAHSDIKTEVELFNASKVIDDIIHTPGRIAKFRYPWPVRPVRNFNGFKAPLNRWLNEELGKLEENNRAIESKLHELETKCLTISREKSSRAVFIHEELHNVTQAIEVIKKELSNLKVENLSIKRRGDQLRRIELPLLMNQLNLIPSWASVFVFSFLSLFILIVPNYITYSSGYFAILLLISLAATSIFIYAGLKYFIYRSINRQIDKICSRLHDIAGLIQSRGDNRKKEIILTGKLRLLVRNQGILEEKIKSVETYSKCCHYHERRINEIIHYWDPLYHVIPDGSEDQSEVHLGFDARFAPEEISVYSLGSSYHVKGVITCSVDAKYVTVTSPLTGLIQTISINPVRP